MTGHGQCYRALGRGVSGDATSLYANWTVVVSFFFSFDVFSVSKLLTVAYATETLS